MPFDIKAESEFIQACAKGNLEAISTFLKKDATLANTPASNGSYPLMLVAQNGDRDLKLVNALLECKAEIDVVPAGSQYLGITALWFAAYYQQWEMVILLLKKGARNLDASPAKGKGQGVTALWLAAYCKQWDIVDLLLTHGAQNLGESPTVGEYQGKTALCWVAAHRDELQRQTQELNSLCKKLSNKEKLCQQKPIKRKKINADINAPGAITTAVTESYPEIRSVRSRRSALHCDASSTLLPQATASSARTLGLQALADCTRGTGVVLRSSARIGLRAKS